MESIAEIIGEERVLELNFDSRYGQLAAEHWNASLRQLEFDEHDELIEPGTLLASARLVRVNLDDGDWLDSLDAESGDLEAVGSAFTDRFRVAGVDEAVLFAESLVVVDFVSVAKEHRGSELSHALVRGIAHIFRSDIIALTPASISAEEAGKLFLDLPKQQGLRRHWGLGGFVPVPGTDVMMLPFGDR